MQVMGGFIIGFDSDTENIFERQIAFIQQIGVVTAMVGLLNALPQTRLWKRLKAENRILNDTTGENTDGSINFIPKIGMEKLTEGYKKVLTTLYSPQYHLNKGAKLWCVRCPHTPQPPYIEKLLVCPLFGQRPLHAGTTLQP